MSDNQTLVGTEISGCTILNKVAEGGMGAVYKARHKALNRIVCVKILSPALANDKKAVELFLTEARAIAELDHPNIVNVYNVGKERGYYFIVMSFIEGPTLSMLLKREKVLPIGSLLDWFEGVLKGLQVAHEKGIIHRDIKPSNILINSDNQAKIVDFGIAKKVDKEKGSTKTTELAGTAYFIAPEQALGKDLDTRADLYSIGASLFYVLTGRFPYNGKNTIEIIQKHINDPVPNPAKFRQDMPGWLALAVQKLMSKNPDDRFQTAKETYEYLHKMRAEEQLRLKTGEGGFAIELGEEGPLKIVKTEKLPTEHIKSRRAEDVYREAVASSSTGPMPKARPMQMTVLDDASAPKPRKQTPPPAQPAPVPLRPAAPASLAVQKAVKNTMQTLLKALFFIPAFMAFAAGIVYSFFTWGRISSVHVQEHAGIISNLFSPLLATEYAPGQLKWTVVCMVLFALILISSRIRAYAKSTAALLAIALVAFMAGLFTPQVPFLDLHEAGAYIMSPEYALCYLALAFAWALSLCWNVDRSNAQSVLACVLVVLSLVLTYSATHLSILPAEGALWTRALFYASLFFGALTIYHLWTERNILFPMLTLCLAIGCMWTYNVSGLTERMNTTLGTLAAKIAPESNLPSLDLNATARIALQSNLGSSAQKQLSVREMINNLPADEKTAYLKEKIAQYAKEYVPAEYYPLFVHQLSLYALEGRNTMKLRNWDYAISFPITNFNANAQTNNAYYFLLMMLFVFASLNCAGNILLREEL